MDALANWLAADPRRITALIVLAMLFVGALEVPS